MTHTRAIASAEPVAAYSDVMRLIEIIDRRFREAVKLVLRRADAHVDPMAGLLLMRLGDKTVRAGELGPGGFYIGTNPSYELDRLVACGLIDRSRRATGDRRVTRIAASPKGREVARAVATMIERQAADVVALGALDGAELAALADRLARLQQFLVEQVVYRQV